MRQAQMERDNKQTGKARKNVAGEPAASKAVKGKAAGSKKPSRAKPREYERPRGGPAKQIADLMPQIGRAAFRRFGFVQSSVVSRWPEIVGERHAKVCLPEAIRFPPGEKTDGILQLVVLPGHAPLIQHVTPEIMERVNRFFGYKAVSRVKLRQGEVKPARAEVKTKAPPSLKPIPMELGDSLRDIGDPELRQVLESMARSLSSKENETE
ncbi:DUF721 domain-containing protein [Altericroceibacterium endophyticum]|uniref:DUF721 domain-containing protein n=1 Tax=Altericroceibacterium endophyticum TaxID=1808508 RepID=A0A6I4T879_9SPHN|nr:DciA family protein [Altericroceibacterium endophyticum]MXO66878.1 DUF721 domain-containing protein [Altericroceibacterium endophyticum]